MKIMHIANVQAGDDVILNNVLHKVEYVEPNGLAYDMQLHTQNGDKVFKCFNADDIVSVNI